MEASTSWNPQGLSRPVMGLLYLYLHLSWIKCHQNRFFSKYLGYPLSVSFHQRCIHPRSITNSHSYWKLHQTVAPSAFGTHFMLNIVNCPATLIYFTPDVLKYPAIITNAKFLHFFTLEDGTNTMSRNVGSRTRTHFAEHPRRAKTAILMHLMPDAKL